MKGEKMKPYMEIKVVFHVGGRSRADKMSLAVCSLAVKLLIGAVVILTGMIKCV